MANDTNCAPNGALVSKIERAQHQDDFQLAVVHPAAVGAGSPARVILRLLLYDHHLRIPGARFLWSHCPGKQRAARCIWLLFAHACRHASWCVEDNIRVQVALLHPRTSAVASTAFETDVECAAHLPDVSATHNASLKTPTTPTAATATAPTAAPTNVWEQLTNLLNFMCSILQSIHRSLNGPKRADVV